MTVQQQLTTVHMYTIILHTLFPYGLLSHKIHYDKVAYKCFV